MPNSLYTTQPANQRPTGNLTMNPTPIPVPVYGSTVTDTMGRTGIAKFNPNTGAALTNPVISGTATKNDVNALGNDITTMTNSSGLTSTNEASNKLLEDRMKSLEESYKADIGGIKTSYEEANRIQTERQGRNYAGRSTGLVTSGGGFLGATQSHQGVLQNLTDTFTNEKNALMAKRDAALQAARDSYDGKAFAIAKEQLDLAKNTEQEIYNRQKDFAEQKLALARENRAQQEFDLGLTDKKVESYTALSDDEFNKLSPIQIEETDKFYYPGYTANKRAIEKKAMDIKSRKDEVSLDVDILNAISKIPAGTRVTLGGKSYVGTKPASGTSTKGLIPGSLALQLGVPSLAGKDEEEVIKSLLLTSAPLWYREFYQASNPEGYALIANNPAAINADWKIFKAQPDIQAYANSATVTSRINKASGTPTISQEDIAAALAGE